MGEFISSRSDTIYISMGSMTSAPKIYVVNHGRFRRNKRGLYSQLVQLVFYAKCDFDFNVVVIYFYMTKKTTIFPFL
jgi:hypothetical protein